MIRYSYNRQVVPPAPFIYVTLRCPASAAQTSALPAQLDTGADITVLPARLVEELHLVQMDEALVSGFGGAVNPVPTFLVEISLHQLPPVTVEVLAGASETCVLLGRDVLNSYRVLLDGPRLAFEIE